MNEVRFCLCENDLIWLAQRLAAVYPGCRSLSRREMAALCEVVAMQIPPDSENTAENPGDIEAAARGLELLFEAMGLRPAPWESAPRHGRLPMVALQPGRGCRVIYGRTEDGLWLIEVPGGTEQCRDLPEGGRYSAILAMPEKTDKSTKQTVPARFRSALKVCKDVFFQAPDPRVFPDARRLLGAGKRGWLDAIDVAWGLE